MAILNYTTTVDAKKTVAEIQEKLSRSGAKRIIIDYDNDNNPSSVAFSITWNAGTVFFNLPCKHENVLRAMQKAKDIRKGLCTKEQAYRVSWRIIKDWVEAQLAIVEAEQATMPEVFLPYAITKDGTTLYDSLNRDNTHLLNG